MANCLSIRTALVAAVNLGWLWTCAQSPPAYVQRRAVNAESSMLGTLPTVWSGDALLTADFNGSDLPVIQRLDRGRVLEKIPFAIPGSKSVRIEALAGWSDGRLAVIGSALHAKGKPWNYLTLIAADRQSAVAKDLENFFPKLIVVAPDGTVWVMGASREPQGTWYNNILRHYDKEGKPLDGRYFYYQPTVDHVTGSVLRCSRDPPGLVDQHQRVHGDHLPGRSDARHRRPLPRRRGLGGGDVHEREQRSNHHGHPSQRLGRLAVRPVQIAMATGGVAEH